MDDEEKWLYNYLNYDNLKNESINYINKIGSLKWNYFGESDPGITILENLIYAILDIDYKISFPVEDILAKNPNKKNQIKNYYNPEEIFPINPVTINDYYRIILDVEGVINCKIVPLKSDNKFFGSYDIYLYIERNNEYDIDTVKKSVIKKLYQNRNIGESFNNIDILDTLDIYIEAEIEPNTEYINGESSYEDFVSTILANIQNFLVPKIQFNTLSDLLYNKGLNLSDIYDGPLLDHGFLTDADIEKNKIKDTIFVIDIIDYLLKDRSVANITSLKLFNCTTGDIYPNIIKLNSNQAIRLNFKMSNVKVTINGIDVGINKERAVMLTKRHYLFLISNNTINDEEIGVFEGNYRNFLDYSSLQNDFPLIYEIGKVGTKCDDKEKDLSSHQLSCYLLLFDQILYLYQLGLENIKNLYTVDFSDSNLEKDKIPNTIPYLDDLIKSPSSYKDITDDNAQFCIQRKYIMDIDIDNSNNILKNHDTYIYSLNANSSITSNEMIINFLFRLYSNIKDNEHFSLFTKKRYISYCNLLESERGKGLDLYNDIPWESSNISGLEKKLAIYWNIKNFNRNFLYKYFEDNVLKWNRFSQDPNIQNKQTNLIYKGKYKNIVDLVLYFGSDKNNYYISKRKSSIVENFKIEYKDTLELKIMINSEKDKYILVSENNHEFTEHNYIKKIINQSVKKIKKFNEEAEGFHLIENTLLRPKKANYDHDDIFFHGLTIIFPNWPCRFQSNEFRNQIKKWLNDNSPAHISSEILWINFEDMKTFEQMYSSWYEKINDITISTEEYDKINLDFTTVIKHLIAKYTGTLEINEDENSFNVFSNPIT